MVFLFFSCDSNPKITCKITRLLKNIVIGTCTIFKPKYSPNSLCERQKPIRLLVNQLKKRKDIAVRKASIASVNAFKGLFAHRLCNPPVS